MGDNYVLLRVLAFSAVFCSLLSGCSSDDNDPNNESVIDASITGRAWSLEEYTSESGELETVIDGSPYQFLLDPESNALSGFFECTGTSGTYVLGDGTVVINFGDRDTVFCTNETPGFQEQSSTVQSILNSQYGADGSALIVQVESETLVLTTSAGLELVFSEVSQLEVGS